MATQTMGFKKLDDEAMSDFRNAYLDKALKAKGLHRKTIGVHDVIYKGDYIVGILTKFCPNLSFVVESILNDSSAHDSLLKKLNSANTIETANLPSALGTIDLEVTILQGEVVAVMNSIKPEKKPGKIVNNAALDWVALYPPPTTDNYRPQLNTEDYYGMTSYQLSADGLNSYMEKIQEYLPGATLLFLYGHITVDHTNQGIPDSLQLKAITSNPLPGIDCNLQLETHYALILEESLKYMERSPLFNPDESPPAKNTAISGLGLNYTAPQRFYSCYGDSFPRSYALQTRLLRQGAHEQGFEVEPISNNMTLIRQQREYTALYFRGMQHGLLTVSRHATNNKQWTRTLLSERGINVPRGDTYRRELSTEAILFAEKLGYPIVIKPLSGSGGQGVITNIADSVQLLNAWQHLSKSSSRIVVESFHAGRDYRLFAVNDRLVAGALRTPAHIYGDGIHSIQQLVSIKNSARALNPYHGAKPIVLDEFSLDYLASKGFSPLAVLSKNELVELQCAANVGLGGESSDVTDRIHPSWGAIVRNIYNAVYKPPHMGIDLIASDISLPPSSQSWAVIEVNCNPDFGVHHFPIEGPQRDVVSTILNLAQLNVSADPKIAGSMRENGHHNKQSVCTDRVSKRVDIKGRVIGVGFRKWIYKAAHERALSGWVLNQLNAPNRVQALFSGHPSAVTDMISICWNGPARSIVEDVIERDSCHPNTNGFIMREI